jgi:hypothetical protein
MELRTWSFGRVIFVSLLWAVLVAVAVHAYMLAIMAVSMWKDSRRAESVGIGAVTVKIRDWIGVALAPPAILGIAWYFLRRG